MSSAITIQSPARPGLRGLPRNVWAVSITSFFMDVSSEMVINVLPLFLTGVLGAPASIVGLIDGIAEATASLFKLFSGWLSDRVGGRKWLAVAGYAISALGKPLFYLAGTWPAVAGVRWLDRVGKGVRTAPRDALVADSVNEKQRGLAFGFHRAADTGGAALGILIAIFVLWLVKGGENLTAAHFRLLVLVSIVPAVAAVLALALGAREVLVKGKRSVPKITFRGLGHDFNRYLLIVGLFALANSSDAFLVLRAKQAGLSVIGVLAMLLTFNVIYSLASTPAGSLSDRIGRKRVIIGGWIAYAAVYLGFGLARGGAAIWALYALYGLFYAATYGNEKALVADIVPKDLRGTAYGTYNGVIGLVTFPASLIAGLLWSGVASWHGFGPGAPFIFDAVLALAAAVALYLWRPASRPQPGA